MVRSVVLHSFLLHLKVKKLPCRLNCVNKFQSLLDPPSVIISYSDAITAIKQMICTYSHQLSKIQHGLSNVKFNKINLFITRDQLGIAVSNMCYQINKR